MGESSSVDAVVGSVVGCSDSGASCFACSVEGSSSCMSCLELSAVVSFAGYLVVLGELAVSVVSVLDFPARYFCKFSVIVDVAVSVRVVVGPEFDACIMACKIVISALSAVLGAGAVSAFESSCVSCAFGTAHSFPLDVLLCADSSVVRWVLVLFLSAVNISCCSEG